MFQPSKSAVLVVLSVSLTTLLAAACGKAEPTAVPTATKGAATGTTTVGGLDVSVTGNNLAFDKATLYANAGSSATLTLHNMATAAALQHNWVLVKKGTEDNVVNAGASAGPNAAYLPTGNANVIVHTKLVDGGKADSLSFTVPAAGAYTYLCSFPGHYAAGMKGEFTSK